MSITTFFSSTCRVRVASAFGKYGKAATFTLGDPKLCRFDPKDNEVATDKNGENVRISGFVYMLPADKPGESDELEVDGDDFRIIKIVQQRAFSDPHHVKIAVRRT